MPLLRLSTDVFSDTTNVTFEVGTNGEVQCFNVSVIVDSILECYEVVTLEFSSEDGIISRNISLTVHDDADAEGIVWNHSMFWRGEVLWAFPEASVDQYVPT